jgi:hypothetical protein
LNRLKYRKSRQRWPKWRKRELISMKKMISLSLRMSSMMKSRGSTLSSLLNAVRRKRPRRKQKAYMRISPTKPRKKNNSTLKNKWIELNES